MFRVVLPPIIRSAYNCIYNNWYLSHRYCYLPLSWKSWNRFECAVGGVRHPQHTQTGSKPETARLSYQIHSPFCGSHYLKPTWTSSQDVNVFAHLSFPGTCQVAVTLEGKLKVCGVFSAYERVRIISASHCTEQKGPQYNCLHGAQMQCNLL
jgi:hypothetical protein